MATIENEKISIAITGAEGAAGATDLEGAVIDMSGYEDILIVTQFGPIVSGAVVSIKAQEGDESDLSDAADLAGTSQTVADDDDNKCFYIKIAKPMKRYIRLYVDIATQNATLTATYIQSKPRKAPVAAQGTNVSGEAFVSPAAGTA